MKAYDFETFLSVSGICHSEIRAICPFHDDRSPSFSANIETGLWICHAGCGQGNYRAFLNSIKSGACTSQGGGQRRHFADEPKRVEDWSLFREVDEYVYLDFNREPKLKVTRYETDSGEKRFNQKRYEKKANWYGHWVSGGVGSLLLLPYRFEDWADSDDPLLLLVEGEKCVRLLMGLGFQATTFPGGATGLKNHYSQYFKGKNVIILPDNDAPGKKFATDALTGIQTVTRAHMVDLPGLGVGEDVFDWFKKGGTLTQFRDLIAI